MSIKTSYTLQHALVPIHSYPDSMTCFPKFILIKPLQIDEVKALAYVQTKLPHKHLSTCRSHTAVYNGNNSLQ